MGVLSCSRNGCSNVMCDRYSRLYGYICNECFEQLVREPRLSIAEFLETDKRTYYEKPDRRPELEAEFTLRGE